MSDSTTRQEPEMAPAPVQVAASSAGPTTENPLQNQQQQEIFSSGRSKLESTFDAVEAHSISVDASESRKEVPR